MVYNLPVCEVMKNKKLITTAALITFFAGNSFTDFMLPNAALRLTQAAGRLLRTESDQGVVTLLDDRLRTKFYGPRLRAALPPFRDYEALPARSGIGHG